MVRIKNPACLDPRLFGFTPRVGHVYQGTVARWRWDGREWKILRVGQMYPDDVDVCRSWSERFWDHSWAPVVLAIVWACSSYLGLIVALAPHRPTWAIVCTAIPCTIVAAVCAFFCVLRVWMMWGDVKRLRVQLYLATGIKPT